MKYGNKDLKCLTLKYNSTKHYITYHHLFITLKHYYFSIGGNNNNNNNKNTNLPAGGNERREESRERERITLEKDPTLREWMKTAQVKNRCCGCCGCC